jgi:hypothetical protein
MLCNNVIHQSTGSKLPKGKTDMYMGIPGCHVLVGLDSISDTEVVLLPQHVFSVNAQNASI